MQETDLSEIVAWLDAGDAADYQAGVLLLQRHAKNRALVAHLLRKESVANREKLGYELVKCGCGGNMGDVHEVLSHYAQAAPTLGVSAPTAQLAPVVALEAVRSDEDALTERASKLYAERVQLSNRLADLDPAAAPVVVAQILDLQEQYNALAAQRRTLAEQPAGEPAAPVADAAPEQPAAAQPLDRAALLQQRGNLRSNISKTKGSIAKAKTEAKKSELEEKLTKFQAELSNVDVQLALPQ